jgi:2-polyprenyl-3-methyl-5-hydroxy-6-metoxy-1,4-benzoquinol methylase
VTFDDRWTVRSAADGPAAVVSLLRRAADHLEALGPVVVRDLTLRREDDGLVLTTRFDRTQMAVDLDYLDPRMVAQFDAGKGERDDFDFVLAIASELEATTIVDLGCGTGQLAVELAVDGRRVIGVEPSPPVAPISS